jgi:ABC-type molybdate transport system permease subunit
MGEFAERQSVVGVEPSLVRDLSAPLYEVRGWIKFIGVLSIIGGVLYVFTIWGIIVCWLPIWIGILLLKVASSVEAAQQNGDRAALMTGMAKLKTYFTITGILAIVGIVAAAIALVVAGGAMLMALRGGMGGAWGM